MLGRLSAGNGGKMTIDQMQEKQSVFATKRCSELPALPVWALRDPEARKPKERLSETNSRHQPSSGSSSNAGSNAPHLRTWSNSRDARGRVAATWRRGTGLGRLCACSNALVQNPRESAHEKSTDRRRTTETEREVFLNFGPLYRFGFSGVFFLSRRRRLRDFSFLSRFPFESPKLSVCRAASPRNLFHPASLCLEFAGASSLCSTTRLRIGTLPPRAWRHHPRPCFSLCGTGVPRIKSSFCVGRIFSVPSVPF